jgi:hypothetical protein
MIRRFLVRVQVGPPKRIVVEHNEVSERIGEPSGWAAQKPHFGDDRE